MTLTYKPLPATFLAAFALVLSGCSSTGTTDGTTQAGGGTATAGSTSGADQSTTGTTAGTAATTGAQSTSAPATTTPSSSDAGNGTPPKNGEEVAVITTNDGTIIFKFLPDKAPKTVANFEKLAGKKFFDGSKFHRVIPGFMIQGGDPNTKGSDRMSYGMGGPGYTVPDEFSDVHHDRGIVSMANTGRPNSGGSQFFICVADAGFLDGKYSAFGQVVKGMDVADKIVNLPRDERDDPTPGNEAVIKSIRIQKWPVK